MKLSLRSVIPSVRIWMPMLLLAFLISCANMFGQVRSAHQKRTRDAVALDCDTALTSDLRKVKRPYKFSDNLYWGINFIANRSLSADAREQSFFPMIRPGIEFTFGKYFSPWISAGVDLGYLMQQESMSSALGKDFTFHSVALSVEGQICLNRLFTRYHANERFMAYAIGSAGLQSTIAYQKIDSIFRPFVEDEFRVSPLFRVGGMFEFRVSESISLSLRGLWTTSTASTCGLVGNHKHSGMEVSLGIISRLPNHYASRSFQDCRGNEIYYFDALETYMLKEHQQQLRRARKGKADLPVMAAEQDSILIFPYGYAYLTPRQEAKLDRYAAELASNPQATLVIDLYPIVTDDPKMTPAQAVQRCEVAIRSHMLKGRDNIQASQLCFIQHSDEPSPIADQHIWVHGAILHFKSSTSQR